MVDHLTEKINVLHYEWFHLCALHLLLHPWDDVLEKNLDDLAVIYTSAPVHLSSIWVALLKYLNNLDQNGNLLRLCDLNQFVV